MEHDEDLCNSGVTLATSNGTRNDHGDDDNDYDDNDDNDDVSHETLFQRLRRRKFTPSDLFLRLPIIACTLIWKSYCTLVREHRISLELLDEAIDKIIFWIPQNNNNGSTNPTGRPWRDIIFGLLSLNRLAMHLSEDDDMTMNTNEFGATVMQGSSSNVEGPVMNTKPIRIAMSIINCLLPTLLEILPSPGPSRSRQQTLLRLRLEQIKFGLRSILLVVYWKQILQLKQPKDVLGLSGKRMGILMDGGMYRAYQQEGITQDHLDTIERKSKYVGRRTGFKVQSYQKYQHRRGNEDPSALQIMIGEILFILRPLYWAAMEANQSSDTESQNSHQQLAGWAVTFAMDLASLRLLNSSCNHTANRPSREEWNRRRMKLFLYLLRSPVWQSATEPTVERGSSILRNIPLMGQFLDAYLWDWILYWKHPYYSEEG